VNFGVVRDPVRHSSCAANSLRWVHSVFCFQEEHGSATSKTAWALVARFHCQHGWGPLFKKCVFQEKSIDGGGMQERVVIAVRTWEDLIERGHVVSWLIKSATAVRRLFLSLTILYPYNNPI
jgi:hypothetical protein